MALENYREVSSGGADINAGFQFEFYCTQCARKWKSPFKPYRKGQITGFLSRFAFLLGGNAAKSSRVTGIAADYGSRGARQEALDEARQLAAARYAECSVCEQGCCMDCLENGGVCVGCIAKKKGSGAATGSDAAGRHACPNCSAASSGGRFCAECGFDMASTHKTCAGCGALAERAARFCPDCGHGF